MKHDFQIVEAKAWHCGAMARALRLEHRKAVAMIGLDSHREMRARFDASTFRKAWMVDGRLAAVGGVSGTALESTGYVWLAFSGEALKYPVQIVKEARRQLDHVMQTKRELVTMILDGDGASKRFAIFLGFTVVDGDARMTAGDRTGRRMAEREIDKNPDARIPVGNGFAVAMTYRQEAP